MASLMKKLRRKRRLSSELDARWGDPSISYPNQGSWNQWDQPSGFVANASMGAASTSFQMRERKEFMSTEPMSTGDFGRSSDSHYYGSDVPVDQLHAISVIPKGYFNENIRHRVDPSRRAPPARGLGINATMRDTNHSQQASAAGEDSCEEGDEESDDDCCEEDHEDLARGRFGQLRYDISVRNPLAADPQSQSSQDNYDRAHDYHQPSKSPPLSVTQRMRRLSQQSAATDPISSTAGTASSRRTSYTAASSVSVPTLPPSTPRLAIKLDHAMHDKRPIHRPRPRMDEAQSQQRMVPSYDELYG